MKNILLALFLLYPLAAGSAEPLAQDAGPVAEAAPARLTLADAERRWEARNRELKLAQDQLSGAAADKLGAAQRPNPQLSLNVLSLDTGRSAPPLGSDTARWSDVVLRLDQPLERGGKRGLRMRGADLRFSAAGQDLADAHRQGRIALYQAYYDLLLAQEKLHISEENARLFRDTVEAAKVRLKTGDIPPSEVSRLKVDALRADNDVQQAQNDLRQAQAALAYLIGAENSASTLQASDTWPAILSAAPTPADIENRPDVRAAAARVEAAQAARDLAHSLKTRDVSVGLQIERNGSNNPLHSVGMGVSVPLLTGYEYQGENAHAEADLQAARDTLEQTRAQAITEINKSRNDLQAAMERVRRFDEQLLAEAKRVLDSSEFAYRKGALPVMDLLDARRTYRATQMDAVAARADYAKALAKARFANQEEAPQ